MKKSIIIDFDNTIGYFPQIIYLINIIETTYKRKMKQEDINILLKIYTYSFRPKIFEILKFVQQLKEKNIIHNLILYTNNKNEIFVRMVLNFIEEYIGYSNKTLNRKIFDHIVFSKTKKNLKPLINFESVYDNIETHICFIDNKNYNYNTESKIIHIYFIECDTYKYHYTHEDIAKKMDYKIYNVLNKKLIYRYFKSIYKNKVMRENLPMKIHEFNSLYIFNLLNNFCLSSK